MTAIEIGQTLSCNDLTVCFWDECVEPPVKKDPYIINYSVGFYEDCCSVSYFNESIEQEPLRASEGCYWVPKLTNNDSSLTPGKYVIKWNWKDTEEGNWQSCTYEFTLYRKGYCLPFQGMQNPCDC